MLFFWPLVNPLKFCFFYSEHMAGWIVLDLVRGHLSLHGVLLSWRFRAQHSALKMRKQEQEGT